MNRIRFPKKWGLWDWVITAALCIPILIGLPSFSGWDCDDYALAIYTTAETLNLDPVIKYSADYLGGAHVWIAVAGIDINGGGSYREATLKELKAWVKGDK